MNLEKKILIISHYGGSGSISNHLVNEFVTNKEEILQEIFRHSFNISSLRQSTVTAIFNIKYPPSQQYRDDDV